MSDLSERAQRLGMTIEIVERKQFGVNASSITALEAVLPDETRIAFSNEADLRAAVRLAEAFAVNQQATTRGIAPRPVPLAQAPTEATSIIDEQPEDEEREEPPAFSQAADAPHASASGVSFADRQAQRMQNRPSVASQQRTPDSKFPIVAQGSTLV